MELVKAARLTALDIPTLRRLVGAGTVERGQAYARRDKVLDVVPSGDRRRIHGSVEGSRAKPYAAWAQLVDHPARPGHSTWSSRCTCPVGHDCKHVVALILVAQQRDAEARAAGEDLEAQGGHWWRGMPPSQWSDWRRALGASGVGEAHDDIAIQLTVVPPPRGRADQGATVTMTPLVAGVRGWIRTGISWTGLDPTSYSSSVKADIDPMQEQALQEMVRAVRARRVGSTYGSVERVSLADLGPQLVTLLRAALHAGVELIDAHERPVRLLDATGRFELHVARDGDDIVLHPRLGLPPELEGADVEPVGLPAVAVLASTDEGLVLAGLDPVLTRVDESLLRTQAVRVPTSDWPAFVLEQLPDLRRRMCVVLDPELADAAASGPRLRITVGRREGHRCEVGLGWRYSVAGEQLDLPWDLGPDARLAGLGLVEPPARRPRRRDSGTRDLATEREILDRLVPTLHPILAAGEAVEAPAVPGASQTRVRRAALPARGRRGAPTAHHEEAWLRTGLVTLPPAATIALAEALPTLRDDPDIVVEEPETLPTYREATQAPVVRLGIEDADPSTHPSHQAPDHVVATSPTSTPLGQHRGTAPAPRRTDWFDLDVSVSVDGEDVPLRDLIVALRTGQEILVLESGTWLRLDGEQLQALAGVLREAADLADDGEESIRVSALHAGLWEELVEHGIVERQSSRWRSTVEGLLGLAPGERPLPAGLHADLRPYQADGFQWLSLLWEARLGGILADDMGLGKTLQTLAMVQRAKEQGDLADPVLIVAPTSVVGTWAGEAARFTPGLRVATVTSTTRKARRPLDALVGDADVVLSSYALVRLDEDAYADRRWSALILDEAQFVKNHQAKTYQVVRRIDASVKIAMTGTPLENSLMDLWSLLSVTAPGLYPRPGDFRDDIVKPIEAGEGAEQLATLRRRIRPLMMRRTKEQVARELPPKIEQVVSVPLTSRHRAIYDTHLQRERQRLLGLLDDDFARNRFAILRALTALRQLALHPALVDEEHAGTGESAKIDLLVEHLRELAAEGHRALVFSQFTGYLRLVRERLEREGIASSYLDGRTRDRARRIEDFRAGDQTAFLISLKAGGFGLTLTEADYVYVLDPWWNPAAEAQAIDRTHRIGQDKPVNVYRLVSEATIEDKVVALQQRKRELFNQVVDDGDALSRAVTADDIRSLLS